MKAMTDADDFFNTFQYLNAEAEYFVSLDGFLHLMKITRDDANFQGYLKQKMEYLLDKVSNPLILKLLYVG